MKIIKVILNWVIFLGLVGGIWYLVNGWSLPVFPHMPGYLVLFFALSIAFVWVEVLKFGSVKPFNCMKCMTGWFALVLAFLFNTQFWYMYLFAGVFLGAMFSAIKMRWL